MVVIKQAHHVVNPQAQIFELGGHDIVHGPHRIVEQLALSAPTVSIVDLVVLVDDCLVPMNCV